VTAILGLSPLSPTASYRNIWRQETPSLSDSYFGPCPLFVPVVFPQSCFLLSLYLCLLFMDIIIYPLVQGSICPKTSMNFNQTKQHSIHKDSTLCSHHRSHTTLHCFYILVLYISYYCMFLLFHLLFLHCRIFAHCHLICLIVNIELWVPFLLFYSYYILFGTDTQISSSTILPISLSCHLTYSLNTH